MLKVTVEDIMSSHVVSIAEDATVGQAAHILLRFRINGVLITQKHNKNVVLGVLTTKDLIDLLGKVLSKRGRRTSELDKLADLPALEAASRVLIRVQKTVKLAWAIALMQKHNAYTLPVYDGEKLVGVLGRHDVFNAAFSR